MERKAVVGVGSGAEAGAVGEGGVLLDAGVGGAHPEEAGGNGGDAGGGDALEVPGVGNELAGTGFGVLGDGVGAVVVVGVDLGGGGELAEVGEAGDGGGG